MNTHLVDWYMRGYAHIYQAMACAILTDCDGAIWDTHLDFYYPWGPGLGAWNNTICK